jgi:hypothetical protein
MIDIEFDCRVRWLEAMLHHQRATNPFTEEWFHVRRSLNKLIDEVRA